MLSALSDVAEHVNGPILFVTAISMFFLVGITVVMVYFTFRYSRRRNPKASEIHGHTVLEIVWTVIPTLLAFGMFWYGWVGYEFMKSPPDDALTVDVTGRMWSWLHEYENGVQTDTLVVPVDRAVRINLHSADVLHSYYIPAFKVKQDAVPGNDNLFLWFTAKEVGEYNVMCAEYCGLQHSGMLTKVKVLPQAEYDQWYQSEGAKVAEMKAALESEGDEEGGVNETLASAGEHLATTKGCVACHSTDGSKLIGPSFKGIYGHEATVVTGGNERTIVVDDEYIRDSILNPNADLVKGYQPLMPSQQGLVTDDEIRALTEYIKSLQ
jgi:cytochrome c oxidase subunit 2